MKFLKFNSDVKKNSVPWKCHEVWLCYEVRTKPIYCRSKTISFWFSCKWARGGGKRLHGGIKDFIPQFIHRKTIS